MATHKELKLLPTAGDSFADIITHNKYYVDKTLFLKHIIYSGIPVIVRPHGFGKTLFMSMMASFFGQNQNDPNDLSLHEKIFKNTAIFKDKEFVERYMGKFPVIYISFKDVTGKTYKDAIENFAKVIATVASKFSYILDSDKLSESEKRRFQHLANYQDTSGEYDDLLSDAIAILTNNISEYYSKPTILLLDDYDVPFVNASVNGFIDKMQFFVDLFLGRLEPLPKNTNNALSPMEKIVLTSSLFIRTDYYKLSPNTLLDTHHFKTIAGFTKKETKELLDYYNLGEYIDLVKTSYGGYACGDEELFNSLSVIKFVSDNYMHKANHEESKIKAHNYLIKDKSTNELKDYLKIALNSNIDTLQDLVGGKSIEKELYPFVTEDEISKKYSCDPFPFLVHKGCLCTQNNDSNYLYSVKIPNEEVLEYIECTCNDLFVQDPVNESISSKLIKCLFKDDSNTAQGLLYKLLQHYLFTRKSSKKTDKKEVYKTFLSQVFSMCSSSIKNYDVVSEEKNTQADFIFTDEQTKKAIIIDVNEGNEKDAKFILERAKKELSTKDYPSLFKSDLTINDIYAYSIIFLDRVCLIVSRKVNFKQKLIKQN